MIVAVEEEVEVECTLAFELDCRDGEEVSGSTPLADRSRVRPLAPVGAVDEEEDELADGFHEDRREDVPPDALDSLRACDDLLPAELLSA